MTFASIIVPAFNVAHTLPQTLTALLEQTHKNFEIIIVDDGSTDETLTVARRFADDARVQIISQRNRGLAGARNSGIWAARGDVIGFCDADDLWLPNKLATHIAHLAENPDVGVSFSGSALINDDGKRMRQAQRPRLRNITPAHIFRRNPIGNGLAPVIRRAVFDAIAYRPDHELVRDWFFDETFRQSEDIECWMRIALTTNWQFEGVNGLLTQYRISAGGLSAATDRQHASWERMVEKLRPCAPDLFARHTDAARGYQLRYLCRRAVSDLDAPRAVALMRRWLATSRVGLVQEPVKSATTLAAVALLRLANPRTVRGLKELRAAQTGLSLRADEAAA